MDAKALIIVQVQVQQNQLFLQQMTAAVAVAMVVVEEYILAELDEEEDEATIAPLDESLQHLQDSLQAAHDRINQATLDMVNSILATAEQQATTTSQQATTAEQQTTTNSQQAATTEQQTSTNTASLQEATRKRRLEEEGEEEAQKKRKTENREKEKEKRKRARTRKSEHTTRCGRKRRVLFKTRCWCTNTAAGQAAIKKRKLEEEEEGEARKAQKRGLRPHHKKNTRTTSVAVVWHRQTGRWLAIENLTEKVASHSYCYVTG